MTRRNGPRHVRSIVADRRLVFVRGGSSSYGWTLCQWYKIERAIMRATRRWPHLSGWRYVESEYYHTMSHDRYCEVFICKQDSRLTVTGFGDGGGETDCAVALALIDAAGKNTTADMLREAIRGALEVLTETSAKGALVACVEATGVLVEALEPSNG